MKKLCYTLLFLFSFIFASNAKTIIRDTEIEKYIQDYSKDVFISAGLNPDMIKIVIIQDDTPNAFVAGGMNIFIHTGLIEMCDTPEELIGVIAHETGHISGGHLARIGDELQSAKANALYSLLLATVVGVGSGDAGAGVAVFAGANETNRRSLLYYSRTQEAVADQNAFRFLKKSRISSEGLLTFLEKLEKQSLLPPSAQAEYLSTHPMSSNRILAVEENLDKDKINHKKISSTKFKIIKEKINGYNNSRKVVLKYKTFTDFDKRYALAIANYRIGEADKAIDIISSLIKKQPKNPYLYELKGQILREDGQTEDAVKAYKKADNIISSPLIKIEYARAMLDTQESKYLDAVILNLNQALQYERQSVNAWQLLATAYKRDKDEGFFRLAQAEADLLTYDLSKSKFNAKKAIEIFKDEKKACQRCEDIVDFIEQQSATK